MTSIVPDQLPVEERRPPARDGATVPLYIVCSVRRSVGKTLLARLLAEFYALDRRPVAAFDLGDDEPGLTDYLPQLTITADIADTRGQMALFDRLISDGDVARVIDVGHRSFKDFFLIVNKIGFFEEARRRSIEPLILFVVDDGPKSAKAYQLLQERFAASSLLAVRNRVAVRGAPALDAFRNQGRPFVSLEIPLLGPPLEAMIMRPAFSFADFWRSLPNESTAALDDELRSWMKRVFVQFREIELRLMCEDILAQLD